MRTHEVTFLVVAVAIVLSLGCMQTITVYWEKPGAGEAELQKDKEECQSLQRAVGLDENRIEKCLEVQGWVPVRQEISDPVPASTSK
ncbi:MAG: hypothetical protein OEZ57_08865 [Nitrospirota bacterium]|nr:hypothetical protein [Nitrospirota bacterium]MDH5587318.1 hypothetical protein [Nitrospirota bacterium]MDH5775012.1 hypothetical protein [Nitrospirota bacterium]